MGKIFGDSFLFEAREALDKYKMGEIMEEALFLKKAIEAGIGYVKKNSNSIKEEMMNDILNGQGGQIIILRYKDFYKELSLPEDPLFETLAIEKCMDAVAETVVWLLKKEGLDAGIPVPYFYDCSCSQIDKGETNVGRRGVNKIPNLQGKLNFN